MESLNRFGILLLASFIIFVVAAMSVQATTLNITVTDAQTGNRLNDVSITVTFEDRAVTTGNSDATGTLEISDLAVGVYTIIVSSPGGCVKFLGAY